MPVQIIHLLIHLAASPCSSRAPWDDSSPTAEECNSSPQDISRIGLKDPAINVMRTRSFVCELDNLILLCVVCYYAILMCYSLCS